MEGGKMSIQSQPFPMFKPNLDSTSMMKLGEPTLPHSSISTDTIAPRTAQHTPMKPILRDEVMHEINLNDVTVNNQETRKSKLFTSKFAVGLVVFSLITSFISLGGFMFVSVMTSWGNQYFWGTIAVGIPLVLLFGIITPMDTFACTMAVPSYKPTWIGIVSFLTYGSYLVVATIWILSLILKFTFGPIPVVLIGLLGFTSNLAICLELLFMVSPSKSPMVRNDANTSSTTPLPVYNPSPVTFSAN